MTAQDGKRERSTIKKGGEVINLKIDDDADDARGVPRPSVMSPKTLHVIYDSESEDLEEDLMRDFDCFSADSGEEND